MSSRTTAVMAGALMLALAGWSQAAVPDNGTGTADLPPVGHWYVTMPGDPMRIIDGLPAGTEILIEATLADYAGVSEVVGGPLGGHVQTYSASLHMSMAGTGTLAGYTRSIFVPVTVGTYSAPRTPGSPVQDFDRDMFHLTGGITGDPDFALLDITAGTDFGLPSPGHTTLTRQGGPGSDFAVDSFFDVTYRIDFTGTGGSVLHEMSGSTTAVSRMVVPEPTTMVLLLGGIVGLFRRKR